LRGSELIALKWSKVDLFDNNMTIDERIREGETDQTKSKRVRVIDILPPVQNALLNQYQITNDSEYLFLTQYGKPYDTPDALRESLKTLCKQANVKHGTFQTIRATCNTLYKQYGMPNDWILHQIGHLEDKVNQDHYTGKIQADLSKFNDLIPP
ncbi:MAG: tyrosine-type recombinase/integrase, partial [Campylobacterota bacterium]|nr:tyrosine-type recombinase/integrase [Campylobacterota bacterium]